MDRGVPCCAADAARRVRRIVVNGNQVGMAELDRVLEEVRALAPATDEEARTALLERARVYNYIPQQSDRAYAEALLVAFRISCSEEDGG